MPDELLAAMATPPKRRLPTLRPAAAPEPAAEPEPAPAPAQTAQSTPEPPPEPAPRKQPRVKHTKPEPEPAPVGRPPTGRDTRGIGLPGPLADRLRDHCEAEGIPYGEFLMEALDRQWDALEKVYPPLERRRPELPAPRRIPRRTVPGGRRPVNFRLTPEQLSAVDDRKDALGVASRSEFVTKVIELDLGDG